MLISAALQPQGPPMRVVERVQRDGQICLSPFMIEQFAALLERPKLARYIPVAKRRSLVEQLTRAAVLVSPTEPIKACRDPDDDHILATALAATADCIVTGDQDLLVLDPFRGVRIVTPRQFLETVADR